MTTVPPTRFRRALAVMLWTSAAGAAAMLATAAALGRLDGVVAQLLLTSVALVLGAWLMRAQMAGRDRCKEGGLSKLLSVGVAGIVISQLSFLLLVWTQWKAWTLFWRIWWVSMVFSVLLTHLMLLRPSAGRKWSVLGVLASVFAVWAGGMIGWLGLRGDMLGDIPPAFLWTALVPAAGTVATSLAMLIRWVLATSEAGAIQKRTAIAGMFLSHVVFAAVAFYVGRATIGRSGPPAAGPVGAVGAVQDDVRTQWGKDLYAAQSRIAEYFGDTRIIGREPFISVQTALEIQPRLQVGDIILERRNWYLSNPWLPGFWPHAALYIGTLADMKALGVDTHPAVAKHLPELSKPAEDGYPKTILEAVSEGVVLNSLPHSIHADYVAVLRPRLSKEQIAEAIATAFSHHGKPYDFNFDFTDTDRLVCTQLVFLAYQGKVDFECVRVMGRTTLPALEIARKYVAERGRPDRQLDFVLFLDGVPQTGTARFASEEEFCESIKRPRAFVER